MVFLFKSITQWLVAWLVCKAEKVWRDIEGGVRRVIRSHEVVHAMKIEISQNRKWNHYQICNISTNNNFQHPNFQYFRIKLFTKTLFLPSRKEKSRKIVIAKENINIWQISFAFLSFQHENFLPFPTFFFGETFSKKEFSILNSIMLTHTRYHLLFLEEKFQLKMENSFSPSPLSSRSINFCGFLYVCILLDSYATNRADT